VKRWLRRARWPKFILSIAIFMKMNNNHKNKLFEIINNESFTSKFISGIAGDRMLDDKEKTLFEKL